MAVNSVNSRIQPGGVHLGPRLPIWRDSAAEEGLFGAFAVECDFSRRSREWDQRAGAERRAGTSIAEIFVGGLSRHKDCRGLR